jgi:hypothetical protein
MPPKCYLSCFRRLDVTVSRRKEHTLLPDRRPGAACSPAPRGYERCLLVSAAIQQIGPSLSLQAERRSPIYSGKLPQVFRSFVMGAGNCLAVCCRQA